MSHYDVFISYARDDNAFVEAVTKRLIKDKYKIWWDTISIRPGELWRSAIEQGIKNSSYFLLLATKVSLSRVEVQREIKIALDHKKPIIAMALDKDVFGDLPDSVRDYNGILLNVMDDDVAYAKLETELNKKVESRIYQTAEDLLNIYRQDDHTTFGDLEDDWVSSMSFNDKLDSPVGLFVGSSLYRASAMLWGRRNESIYPPTTHPMQVYLHFTGKTKTATFDQYIDYIETTDMRLWTLYIRGSYDPGEKEFKLQDEGDSAHLMWQDSAKFVIDSIETVEYRNNHWAFFLHTPNPLPMMLSDYGIGNQPYDIYHHKKQTKDPEKYYIRVHHHDAK